MRILARRTHWLWASWLATLASSVSVGVARAEPPVGESRSGTPIVSVAEEAVRAAADELGEYIEQLEGHLDWMHRRAEWRRDSGTVAAVEAIQKKLEVAKEHHRTLCRICDKELQDTRMARECCQVVDDTMHEVIADHLALMRRLRTRPNRPSRIRRIDMDTRPEPLLLRWQLARGS